MKGNHFAAIRSSMLPARDVVAHQREERPRRRSARGSGAPACGWRCRASSPTVRIAAMITYMTALLKSSGPGRLIHVIEPELLLRLEVRVVVAGGAEDRDQRDDREQVEPGDAEQDLAACCSWVGGLPSLRAGRDAGDEVDREGGGDEDRGRQAVLALPRQADDEDGKAQEPSASQAREEREAGDRLGVVRRRPRGARRERGESASRSTRRRRRRSRAPAGPSAARTAPPRRRG